MDRRSYDGVTPREGATLSPKSLRIDPLSFPRAQGLALSVVVAVTDGGANLASLLARLRDARISLSFEVLVVVGGEAAPALRAARSDHPLVLMYRLPQTVELGALYDAGARAAGGRQLLLLDGTAVPDAAAIAELVRFAESGQWISAVVPRCTDQDGVERPTTRSFPTPARAIAEALGRDQAIDRPAPRLQYALNRKVTTPKEVEAVEGGCVLVRRQAVVDVGAFAAGYGPGGELLDWCMRARQRGWAVFYHPGVSAALTPGLAPLSSAERRAIARRFVRRFYGMVPAGLLMLAGSPAGLRRREISATPPATPLPGGAVLAPQT